MYPEIMVVPMREELTRLGVQELRTPADVDRELGQQQGTAMVVVNSICGCAAGRMRPAVRAALQHQARPNRVFTVFAVFNANTRSARHTYDNRLVPRHPVNHRHLLRRSRTVPHPPIRIFAIDNFL